MPPLNHRLSPSGARPFAVQARRLKSETDGFCAVAVLPILPRECDNLLTTSDLYLSAWREKEDLLPPSGNQEPENGRSIPPRH